MKVTKNKNPVFVFMLLFTFLFSFTLVSAVPVLVSPSTGGTLSGANAVLNVTNGTLIEMLNCTWYAISSSTANSTAVSIGVQTNESVSADHINMTFDSTILEDSNDYNVYAQCFNATSDETTVYSTGVIIDNTVPTSPTISPADLSSITSSGTQTFTGTVVDAETTSCTYTIYRGGSSSDGSAGSGVYSGTSCTFTKAFSSSADNGVWHATIIASDGTNTTSSVSKVTVSIPGAGGGLITPLTTTQGTLDSISEENGWKWILGIVIILGIIGMIYMFSRKN
ncbi:MAG: hypothetical protein U9Q73_00395 [Nanoarchaeota archaeon]|nr:hypothetical protein [Nanoarchaeota archaeon]